MKKISPTTRRDFLKIMGVTGGGLVLGVPSFGYAQDDTKNTRSQSFQPNALLQLTVNNEIHFYLPRSEMGQGVYTGLTTLIAEELEVQPASINIHHANVHKDYRNPEFSMQITGGSTSTKVSYLPIRQVAANAREAIRAAAAQQLDIPIEQLKFQNGNVSWQEQIKPFGDFVELAATLPIPNNTPLKQASEFTLIGKDIPRLDAMAKSTGTAVFGIDVELPELYKAALKRCPVHNGKVKSVDSAAAQAMPGVEQVVQVFNGVAVVAKTYWQARKAVEKLDVQWDLPPLAKHSSSTILQDFKSALDNDSGDQAHKQGKGKKALSEASETVQADYWAPYLAHAAMEPLNCTVKIENDQCDVWVGSQAPEIAQRVAALYSGIDEDRVNIHSLFLGGGFGRRAASDNVAEAVSIAKACGLPIQLVWSREDDTQHDRYRPAALARFEAGISDQGILETLSVKRVGPNIMPYTLDEVADAILPGFIPEGVADWLSKRGYGLYDGILVDESSVEGLFEDYDIVNKEARHVTVDPGLPLGFWRSVGHSFSGFFKESFMDEVALAAKRDPVEFRLGHTKNDKRLHDVIKHVADKANWGTTSTPGHFQGIAAHNSFNSAVAQIAEISIDNGKIHIHKVTCTVDCGLAINPDIVKSQVEGSIIFGITAALYGEITLRDGAVQQGNFHDYSMLRMNESPIIEVHIIDSQDSPTGIGEPAVPPIAAAISNAVFTATGKRLRELPLRL